jgi:hypothetical protein
MGVAVAESCVAPVCPSFAALPLPSDDWFADGLGSIADVKSATSAEPAVYIAWCGAVKVTFVAVAVTSRAATPPTVTPLTAASPVPATVIVTPPASGTCAGLTDFATGFAVGVEEPPPSAPDPLPAPLPPPLPDEHAATASPIPVTPARDSRERRVNEAVMVLPRVGDDTA